jgi:hypothetical protein
MIASYMDESFDMRNQGVFVVGGFLGRGVAIFELARRWEALRKRPDIDIQYFKASHLERGQGEFRKFVADPRNIMATERAKLDSISHEFLNLIVHPVAFDSRSYLCVYGVGVVQQDFYDVIKDADARAVLGVSPHPSPPPGSGVLAHCASPTHAQQSSSHTFRIPTEEYRHELPLAPA